PADAVDPACLVVRITLGRRRAPQRLAEQLLARGETRGIDDGDTCRAYHAGYPFARTLELRSWPAPRVIRRHHRDRDLLEIALGVAKGLGDLLDQRRRRLVRHEMARELCRDLDRGRRVRG